MLDCFQKWFYPLYADPIRTFVKNPTFRITLASHIRNMRGSDLTKWPPLALLDTYPAALDSLKDSSTWLDPKVSVLYSFARGLSSAVDKVLFWRSLLKKMHKEVVRRWRSYMNDMGITGPIIILLCLVYNPRDDVLKSVDMLLKALPDQDVVATHKLTGLGTCHFRFPSYDVGVHAQLFLDPTLLETLFTVLPWQSAPNLDDILEHLPLAFSYIFMGRDGDVIRFLSLRNLPQNNPRWDDDAKRLFSRVLDRFLDEVRTLQTP